jgi:peptidyl-prolyl cis-trans isomerase SurA
VNESCTTFEESRLDEKHPDFKALMQEYRDGILLFELTDKKVWSKAIKDSVGLKNFYDEHKNNYMWNERLDATIYTCANAAVAKQVRAMLSKKNPNNDKILAEVNKSSALNLTVKEGKFSMSDNDIIDGIKWEKGLTPAIEKGNTTVFVLVKNKMAPQPKTLEEAKGLVTADYQAFLEKVWIDSLKKKYPVAVNKEVLNSIGK